MGLWNITYNKFNPDKENFLESILSIGNGYFGVRGSDTEISSNKIHYSGVYVAGVYNKLITKVCNKEIENEDFVNCPNWLFLTFKIGDDKWFDICEHRVLYWKKEIQLKNGIFYRKYRVQDKKGRITTIEEKRLVSMVNPHCAGLQYKIIPENYSEDIFIRSGIDGVIINNNVDRYRKLRSKHLKGISCGKIEGDGIYLQVQTVQSKIQITQAIRTLIYEKNKLMKVKRKIFNKLNISIFEEIKISVKKKNMYTIEKLQSIYTSRDIGIDNNVIKAQESVFHINNFNELYKKHKEKWVSLWKRFDIEVEGNDFIQRVLRLHIFHLIQSASIYNDEIDAGMPVRGLNGESYRGHIFWDELFAFPFYNLHSSEITRSLLMYRYRRLFAAKENAKK